MPTARFREPTSRLRHAPGMPLIAATS